MTFIRQESIDEVGRLAEADEKAETNKLLAKYCQIFKECIIIRGLTANYILAKDIETKLKENGVSKTEIAEAIYDEFMMVKEYFKTRH